MPALKRHVSRPFEPVIVGQHGRHRILRRLGDGGMAETFLATSADPRRGLPLRYCIKRMHLNVSRSDFEEEAKVHMQLSHGLVVRAYDLDEDEGGRLFLVLEHVDGIDLGKLLAYYANNRRRMPVGLAVYIIHEVAEALHYVHTFASDQLRNLIHRDISPENILIGRDGSVKLADFGIVARDGRARLTRAGVAKGKTPYLAAERFDVSRGVDHRSDLFSLGVVFYEALCGEMPFAGEQDGAAPVMRAILAGEFEPLSTYAPGLSAHLTSLVSELLSNDKHKRPASALDVVARLESLELLGTIERVVAPRRALGTVVEACLATATSPQDASEQALERAEFVEELGQEILYPTASSLGLTAVPETEDVTSSHEVLTSRGRAHDESASEEAPVPSAAEAHGDAYGPPPALAARSAQAAAETPRTLATNPPTRRASWVRGTLAATALTVLALAGAWRIVLSTSEGQKARPLHQPTHIDVPAPPATRPDTLPTTPEQALPVPAAASRSAASNATDEPARPDPRELVPAANDNVAASPSTEHQTGLLIVQVRHWGWVYIDRKLVGFAPVEVRLPEGAHIVEISESETERTRHAQKLTVDIKGGQILRRTVTLQHGAGLFEKSSPGSGHDKH